ncbi:ring finger domain-containing protein [Apiospora rasikravindrae]|uniref:Ring finger domain-containing protein n=1 Tax=Apiospora rasikravindrae TaxID=990691 RepID=A0ABR1T2X6_9PEZI
MAGPAPSSTVSDPGHGPTTTVNTGSIAAGVSIALAIALALIFLIACNSCAFGPLGALRETTNRRSQKHAHGLDSTVVNSFPIIQYQQPKTSPDKAIRKPRGQTIDEEAGGSKSLRGERGILARLQITRPNTILGRPCTRRGQGTSCTICTDDFVEGVDVRKLSCGHLFHPTCVDQWLAEFAATCPVWQVIPFPSLLHGPRRPMPTVTLVISPP